MKKTTGLTKTSRKSGSAEEIIEQNRKTISVLKRRLQSAQARLKSEGMLKYILNQKFHGIPMSIEDVNIMDVILPRNIRDRLKWNGIETVRDLKKKTENDLLVILKPAGGEVCIKRVKDFMKDAGLRLKKESK